MQVEIDGAESQEQQQAQQQEGGQAEQVNEDEALAAFDKGLQEHESSEQVSAPADAPPKENQEGDAGAPSDAVPEEKQTTDVETEISELKLGDRSAARFREMSSEIKELRSALEQAGVTDLAALPQALEKAKAAEEMVQMVMETGATAEQYGQTLDYLRLVNGALSGDREATEKAFEVVEREYKALAQALGRKVDGVDPLQDNADLRDRVNAGLLDEEAAYEIARYRAQQKGIEQAQQAKQAQTEQQQAIEYGRQALKDWDMQMMQANPDYALKRDALSAQVAVIRENLPPHKWLAATQQLYMTLSALQPAAPAAPAKPVPGPVRPRAAPALHRQFESAEEAFDYGLSAGGR